MRATRSWAPPLPFYPLLRPLLFLLDPESSHRLTFKLLPLLRANPLARDCTPQLPTTIAGLALRNPVGLAAGLDKNAECVEPLAGFGFGFVELGTVTPRAQAGNPRPRLFRLTAERALINRLGFPNGGVDAFLANLQRARRSCPIGINIGKNKDTPNERALDDYLGALRAVYTFADYITVNISSPNTPGLRALQQGAQLETLLGGLADERRTLATKHGQRVPLALKVAPDLDDAQLEEIARLVEQHGFDMIIATNTTVARPRLAGVALAQETGGLSGRALAPLSTDVIRKLYRRLQGRVPIIGVGGIENADDAWEKLVAGADALQIYTALIYRGPTVVREIVDGLKQRVVASGSADLAAALKRVRSG
jgi:dihydroorotate dehydrogenase